jgi:glucose/arabinose dehydrogenase
MRRLLTGIALAALLSGCGSDGDDGTIVTPTPTPTPAPTPAPTPTPTGYVATRVATGSYAALTFLPDGRALYVQRDGTVLVAPSSTPEAPVAILGKVNAFQVAGSGVIDVVADPDFASNGLIYVSTVEGSLQTTAAVIIARFRLTGAGVGQQIVEGTRLWRSDAVPVTNSIGRFGGYMAFKDGLLHMSLGDFGRPELAQDLTVSIGKTIRINRDGTPAAGNPLLGTPGAQFDVFTAGHREPAGLTLGSDGRLYETEVAPEVGDEINVIEGNRNYGWPLVSEGNRDDGTPFPRHSTRSDIAAPAYVWTTTMAPGRIIQVRSNADGLAGELLVASQGRQRVDRFRVANGGIVANGTINVNSPVTTLAEAQSGKVYGLTYETGGVVFRIDRN